MRARRRGSAVAGTDARGIRINCNPRINTVMPRRPSRPASGQISRCIFTLPVIFCTLVSSASLEAADRSFVRTFVRSRRHRATTLTRMQFIGARDAGNAINRRNRSDREARRGALVRNAEIINWEKCRGISLEPCRNYDAPSTRCGFLSPNTQPLARNLALSERKR